MNSKLKKIVKNLIFFNVLFITLQLNATNYYVSNGGDNSADGTSPETAWRTITHVNSQTFSPGDSILFERSNVWRIPQDVALSVSDDGSAEQYITYGAYGTGDKPRILGSNQVNGWTQVNGNIWQTELTYNPRETGYGAELFFEHDDKTALWGLNVNYSTDFSNMENDLDWSYSNNTAYVYSETHPDTRFVSVEAPRTSRLFYINNHEYIAIDNIEFAYSTNIGIYDSYGSDNISGLRITNCHIHHIGHKDSGQGFGLSLKHSDMYIAYNDIHDSGRRNISLVTYKTEPAMNINNILIEHNYLHDGWHTTGVDINTTGGHIYDSIVIRNNLFYDPLEGDISKDNFPQYKSLTSNHIYIAEQGTGAFSNIYVYNNIFWGHHGTGVLIQAGENIRVDNNTFYGYNNTLDSYSGFVIASRSQNLRVRNNIFYDNAPSSQYLDLYCVSINDSSTTYSQLEMDHNLYMEDDPNSRFFILINTEDGAERQYYPYTYINYNQYIYTLITDGNSVKADPLFQDKENGNFRLKEESPAKNAGTPISYITKDYYGNLRNPNTPTIGAIEYLDSDSSDIENSKLTEIHTNPVVKKLHIENVLGHTIRIIDVSGVVVFNKKNNEQQITINIDFQSGVYILQIIK